MAVFILVEGRPELWGSPRLGLSAIERREYEELLAHHARDEAELLRRIGSGSARMRSAIRRGTGEELDPTEIRLTELICQRLERTRRALRGFLVDPDISLEWAWRYWVGRELAEMRGSTGCVEITPGFRTAWGDNRFAERPGLSAPDRAQVKILLGGWESVIDRLRQANLPFPSLGLSEQGPLRLSVRDGGQLLATEYAYERQLLAFSAYPSVAPDLPLPTAMKFSTSVAGEVSPPRDHPFDADRAPIAKLRLPTDDDRANFQNEGIWNQLTRSQRLAAIDRAYNAVWTADGRPTHGISLIDNSDLVEKAPSGDVDAWKRIWYLCRNIVPPGEPQFLRYVRRDSESVSSHGRSTDTVDDDKIAMDDSSSVGLPERGRLFDPQPWRDTDARPRPSVGDSEDAQLGLQDREILRLWTDKGLSAEAIGSRIGRDRKTVLNRLSALRKELGEDRVRLRVKPRSDPPPR